jgi:hypothetical protein
MFAITTSQTKWSYLNYGYEWNYTEWAFGGRLAYHPNLGIRNLDAYTTLTLGYLGVSVEAKYTGDWGGGYQTSPSAAGVVLSGINFGGRYFFTPMIGGYLELGYSALSYASAGVTIKVGGGGASSRSSSNSNNSSNTRSQGSTQRGTR